MPWDGYYYSGSRYGRKPGGLDVGEVYEMFSWESFVDLSITAPTLSIKLKAGAGSFRCHYSTLTSSIWSPATLLSLSLV